MIHNAVDLALFNGAPPPGAPRAEISPRTPSCSGYMGRVLPRKGYPQMIRAARVLLDWATPEERRRARFVVVGDTPAHIPGDHLGECRALVKECGLEGVFAFPGFSADVRPWVEGFDVRGVPRRTPTRCRAR